MSSLKIGVVRFPGTNCDRDVFQWLKDQGHKPEWLWHEDLFETKSIEALAIPGGFSFGDYLRSGAVAARSKVMQSVKEVADSGKPVIGICNGFQILCEAGLLPGALIPNEAGLFIDDWVELQSPQNKKAIKLPIAHGDGRYFIQEEEKKKLWDQNQVWWQYKSSPNGSVDKIAGVTNKAGNVKGLMPHPERAYRDWMGGVDGWKFWI
jgi:phosphoribosylformylglycinamidine synthase subunit PurQ / glutaminase